MTLLLVGVNHRTAPVEVRERLSGATLDGLRALPGIDGAALLSTCNRVEAVVSAASEDVIEPIVDWLCARASAGRTELEKHLYVIRHADVVKHLFRVASGLDSMIVGEPQIAGQVREAFLLSRDRGALDPLLTQLFDQTMRVAKRVRTDTGIGEHAVSVPYAAVELAKKIFGELEGLKVLLLGAGEMAELTAEHLAQHRVQHIFVANRAQQRAQELAARFHGIAHAVRGRPFLSGGLRHRHRFHRRAALRHRAPAHRARPHRAPLRNLFLIDLSVPRNIDPAIAEVDGAYLYNIDDLQHVADANRGLRMQKAQEAEEIVAREVDGFRKRLVAQDAVPTIVELQQRLEAIRAAELEKCLRKVGPISTEQREAIEMLSTQMINKILHYPILQLKEPVDEPERDALRRTIRKIFGLR